MEVSEEALYHMSIDFIQNNKDCLSTEIPMKYVNFWILDHDNITGPEFGIFMCVLAESEKHNGTINLHTLSDLVGLAKKFQTWQEVLKIIKEKHDLGLPIPLFKLFDFNVIKSVVE